MKKTQSCHDSPGKKIEENVYGYAPIGKNTQKTKNKKVKKKKRKDKRDPLLGEFQCSYKLSLCKYTKRTL